MWIFDPFGFFEDDEDVAEPAFSEKAVESSWEETQGKVKDFVNKVIPDAKEKWNQAKEEELKGKDEPDPIPVAKSDDPYAQEDKYENTTEY
jgi:uncharacterized protein YjbJ (UPF0337 family)